MFLLNMTENFGKNLVIILLLLSLAINLVSFLKRILRQTSFSLKLVCQLFFLDDGKWWLLLFTVDAIKKIEEIKSKRQTSFVMRRLRQATAIEQRRDNREVQINKSLIRAPGASKFKFHLIFTTISSKRKNQENYQPQMRSAKCYLTASFMNLPIQSNCQ